MSPWPVLRACGVGLRPGALLVHEPAEALLVDGEPGLGRHLQREVDREAVGVVQLEGLVAGQLRAPGPLRVAATAVSKIREPVTRVARKASSSARTTAEIRSKSAVSSGYDGLISSRTTSAKLCSTGSFTPSSRAERTIRRSRRRST